MKLPIPELISYMLEIGEQLKEEQEQAEEAGRRRR